MTLQLFAHEEFDAHERVVFGFDAETGLRFGHATMDVRYRDGGYDANPATPFSSYTMLMEFNPMDVDLKEVIRDYIKVYIKK